MNVVKIDEAKVIEAAKAGNDEFVDVFYNAILDFCGGAITAETMQSINSEQMTLMVFKILHEEVMDGGFVQLIYNGYGPFIFFNPFAKAMKAWGLEDLSSLVNKAGRLFRKYGKEIQQECSDEEFMAMFERYPKFDELDDEFVENEERWVGEIAHYIDEHIDHFAQII